jgi:hypothetical protein
VVGIFVLKLSPTSSKSSLVVAGYCAGKNLSEYRFVSCWHDNCTQRKHLHPNLKVETLKLGCGVMSAALPTSGSNV